MENCIGTVPIHLKMTLTTKEVVECYHKNRVSQCKEIW